MTTYICKKHNSNMHTKEEVMKHIRRTHSREMRRVYIGLKPYSYEELFERDIEVKEE